MKKTITGAITLVALLAASCQMPLVQENKWAPSTIEITASQDEFSADGGEVTVNILCSDVWKVRLEDSSWVKTSDLRYLPEIGGSLKLTVSSNNTYDSRKSALVVKTDYAEERFSFSQLQNDAVIVPDNTRLFDFAGGTFFLPIKSNVEYSVRSTEPWVRKLDTKGLSESNDNFSVDAFDEYGTTREAFLVYEAAGKEFARIRIVQEGRDIITASTVQGIFCLSNPDSFTLEAGASQYSITYFRDGSVSARFLYPDALNVASLSGLGKGLERGGEVTLTLDRWLGAVPVSGKSIKFRVVDVQEPLMWLRDTADGSDIFAIVSFE